MNGGSRVEVRLLPRSLDKRKKEKKYVDHDFMGNPDAGTSPC
jgi:hypothetical protein